MSKRKHGLLGLFGLVAVMALGVTAYASMAQAATPRFLVGGTLAGVTTVEGSQEGRGTLSIAALNTEINCEKSKVVSGQILTSVDEDLSLLFEECTVLEAKATLAELPCTVTDTHKASALPHITVLSVLLSPIEFGDGTFGLFIVFAGVFINFKSGTGCPLPLKTEIKGSACSKITAGNNTTEPLSQFSEAVQKAAGCGGKILYGANEAFLTGSLKGWVTGKGKTLGVALD